MITWISGGILLTMICLTGEDWMRDLPPWARFIYITITVTSLLVFLYTCRESYHFDDENETG